MKSPPRQGAPPSSDSELLRHAHASPTENEFACEEVRLHSSGAVPGESEWIEVDRGRMSLGVWREPDPVDRLATRPPGRRRTVATVILLLGLMCLAVAFKISGAQSAPLERDPLARFQDIEAQQLASDIYALELEYRRRNGHFTSALAELQSTTGGAFTLSGRPTLPAPGQISLSVSDSGGSLCQAVTSASGVSYLASATVEEGRFAMRYHRDPSGGSAPDGCAPDMTQTWSRRCSEGWELAAPAPGTDLLCRD